MADETNPAPAPQTGDARGSRPAADGVAPSPARVAPPATADAPAERRHPLRFVWQMDLDNRFTLDSQEFIRLLGPRTAAALGRPWPEMASELALDTEGRVAQAVGTRNTWSGLNVAWPADGSAERLIVEMSGLPVFDRDRTFRGYRGFGVCRDLARLAALARLRREATAAAGLPAEPPREPAAAAPAPAQPAGPAPPPAPPAASPHPALEPPAPTLSPLERHAFYELSRRLAQRLTAGSDETGEPEDDFAQPDLADTLVAGAHDVRTMFERLPIGVLIYRLDALIYANPAFLQAIGHRSVDELAEAGGLDSLLVTPASGNVEEASGKPLALTIERSGRERLDAELVRIDWDGEMAHALITKAPVAEFREPPEPAPPADSAELTELRSIVDTATDGVVMLDRAGTILSASRSAEALFGYEAGEFAGKSLFDLLAPESHDLASTYLDSLRDDAVAAMLNSGRELVGRGRHGGLSPLFMTLGIVGERKDRLCAVFRDLTQWKRTEEELVAARQQAEKSSAAKSDFLAKVSHEIRTPLNAIIGFSEVMMEERFGPVGNERYRGYLKDIHASGELLLSLINDLLDLSKIEAGKLELTFASVSLNELTRQCVGIMQPQANRERVIIRTALAPQLPPVTADARSVRQIVLNLLTNSIKFTGAGGQVIVSTALKDDGAVVLRVRDTGIGMSEKDLATALEPFRQVATTGRPGGTGLGLPLTKALAEANQAKFAIKSAPKEGTLVEIAFPASRVPVG
jgi:PAS domain S-box-containing protein